MDRRDDRLELSSDEMRRLGHRVVDMLVDHVESLAGTRVARTADRASLRDALGEVAPRAPVPIDDVLDAVATTVLGSISHVDHPRFFAYVPSPGNFVGAMADALAAGFNVFAGAWPVASGPAEIELELIEWLRGLCGLPEGAGGLFVSGGSIANLTALIVARDQLSEHERERAVIYYSDQTHSSIGRALDVLGVPADRRRTIARPRHPFGAEDIAPVIESDRAAGFHPWCVVANGGATSTGEVDELGGIGGLCARERVWMHVDAAYGGGALLSGTLRGALGGIERADSVTLDPHKWLFQPFDIGCVLVRDERLLEGSFQSIPAYLRDSARRDDQVNFRDRGIELTRPFRALKLWMTLQIFGADAMSSAVERGVEIARSAERRLRGSGLWRMERSNVGLGIVTFRHVRFDDDAHRRLAALLLADGYAMLSTTEVDGSVCLRLCTINPRTSDDDIIGTIAKLEELAPLAVQS